MFGYVLTYKPEMKGKDSDLYRAYYCGLCKILHKEYGFSAKFLLNYDCTFAAVLLSCVSGEKAKITPQKCTFCHLCKKYPISEGNRVFSFVAAMNVLLAYYSMEDNVKDEKKALSKAGTVMIKRAKKKAAANYPQMDKIIKNSLSELEKAEREKIQNIDVPTNIYAKLLSGIVGLFDTGNESSDKMLEILCFNLGRWIYLADALDDMEKDRRKGNYNPINLSGMEKDRVVSLMYLALKNAHDAFELIDIDNKRLVDIIDNVLIYGCPDVTEAVKRGTFRKKKEKQYKYDTEETE